jgi:hypothetical protein
MKLRTEIFILLLLACLAQGCGASGGGVNADTHSFVSKWKYTSTMGGTKTIALTVKDRKFRINDNIIYDGTTLYSVNAADRRVDYMQVSSFSDIPFWKMSLRVRPFPAPTQVREEKHLGRTVRVLQVKGERDGAPITFTYWIDKENNILLKKTHVIGYLEDPIFRDTYECISIDLESPIEESLFEYQIPSDYVKVKLRTLPTDLLRTFF